MFGKQWAGNEFKAQKPSSMRAAAEDASIRHKEASEALMRARSASANPDFQRSVTQELEKLSKPTAAESSDRSGDHQIPFERRIAVETELRRAIDSGELVAFLDGDVALDPSQISGNRHFRLDVHLSMTRIPATLLGGHRRHVVVLFRRGEFDDWLEDNHPLQLDPDSKEYKAQKARNALQRRIDLNQTWTKVAFRKWARTELGLTGYRAGKIWDAMVPESWKKPGNPGRKN
ncbi:hypothetical protein SAMN05660686_04905 [Thalassobaculum litoreum DSM 18839]|uniref:Uncharacterized protein n=2 Tax=Thalassobaculum TaxID=526215 RepID=A0A8G2BNK5_9PROT|nr:hypothetical protein SAMN05660686_04905 [Thalassobaculum litoreum DSM 18839]